MPSSTGAPTITARLNTAVAVRIDLSGNRLATATIAWASTWVPSTRLTIILAARSRRRPCHRPVERNVEQVQ